MQQSTIHTGITTISIADFDRVILESGLTVEHAIVGKAEDVAQCTVEHDGQLLTLKGPKMEESGGRNITITGNNVVMSSFSSVTINGRDVSTTHTQKRTEPLILKMHVPAGTNLELDFNGLTNIESTATLGDVDMNVSGPGTTIFRTIRSLDLNASGTGSVIVGSMSGSLKANLSGVGQLRVAGAFETMDIRLSGVGSADLRGDVVGDARFAISGVGNIKHRGTIGGRLRKQESGLGTISSRPY